MIKKSNPKQPKLSTRKCKNCGEVFQKITPLHSVCSIKCAIAHSKTLEVKRERMESKKAKAETRDKLNKIKTRSQWLKEAQVIVNKYIRLRDVGLNCISCNKPMLKKINAGHYLSVGAHPELRFNELNIHAQCEHCNSYKSGNISLYRPRLIEKIGLLMVEWLEGRHNPKKYTIDDIKFIIKQHKEKIKQLTIKE